MKRHVSALVYACTLASLLLHVQDAPSSEHEETLIHMYGPFDLAADTLQQVPPKMEFTFPEDMWLVGYSAEIVDPSGNRLARELQCHTFLGASMPLHHKHEQVVGLFSDGYTENFRLPEGFGLLFPAGKKIIWMPMFNNRNSERARVTMKLTLQVIRAKNLRAPLKPLTTTFRTMQTPDLYYVPPGKNVRESTFELPFSGRIHAMGTHIHPYGVSIELINVTRNETVWKAIGSRNSKGELLQMPVYTNPEGYVVRPDDRFKLAAVYENTSSKSIDAMAGVFVLYEPDPQLPRPDSASAKK